MATPWRYREYPNADKILEKKCAMVLGRLLRTPRYRAASAVKDTRRLHQTIFGRLVDAQRKQFAGHYRGESLPYLENRHGSRRVPVFPGLDVSHRFIRPENVLSAMQKLEEPIDFLFTNLEAISKYEHYRLAVEILVRFYLIHPYVDGNGHIGRILMTYLMSIADIPIHRSWTIHPSPFTNAIGICLFTYRRYPVIAEQYFRQWFSAPMDPISRKLDSTNQDPLYREEYCSTSDDTSSDASDSDSSGSGSSECDSTDYDSSDSGSSESSSSECDSPDSSSSDSDYSPSAGEDITRTKRQTRERGNVTHYQYSEEDYTLCNS